MCLKRKKCDLEAGQTRTNVWYFIFMFDFELWKDGDDGLYGKSADLTPYRLHFVTESLQSPKHSANRPLRAVVLYAQTSGMAPRKGAGRVSGQGGQIFVLPKKIFFRLPTLVFRLPTLP